MLIYIYIDQLNPIFIEGTRYTFHFLLNIYLTFLNQSNQLF